MNTPLQIKGSDTTVCVCDANGKILATINKALGEDDYKTAQAIITACNVHGDLLASLEELVGYHYDDSDSISAEKHNLMPWRVLIDAKTAIEKAKAKGK
ncbi:MAG: hypothetical protein PHP01_07780 [Phycisphaerae bacterium]|nr:hypothetical protein [Phycisphaerae bacterium]